MAQHNDFSEDSKADQEAYDHPQAQEDLTRPKRLEPDWDLTNPSAIITPSATPMAQPNNNQPERPQLGAQGSYASMAMVSLAVMTVVFLFTVIFFYNKFTDLREQLTDVQQSMSQMNMLTESQYDDLTDSLDKTRLQRSKQDEVVQERLKFLDGEMRKLWVISHQTNQPRIIKLEQSLKEAQKKQAQEMEAVKKTVESVKTERKSLDVNLDDLKARMAEIDLRLVDVPVAMEAQQRQLAEMQKKVDKLLELNTDFDEHRARVNRSVDQLFEEVRLLKGGGAKPGL